MGVTATTSWRPTDTAEVVAALADARAADQQVEIRGAGSVLDRLPGRDEPTITTRGLDGIVAHVPEDLIVTVRAGTLLRELAEELAAHGQECPIEPIGADGATVGGRLATALAGPRQLGAGRVRDWVLRVRFVTGGGRAATAGGVTVKDVTGYDLCRLMTGSWGTLGVITEVTLKLRPVPRHPRWFATETPDPQVVGRLYRPAAVVTTAARTHVLLEEHPDDTAAQAAAAGLAPAEPPVLPTTARVALDPAAVPAFLAELGRDGTGSGPAGGVASQDQLGLCHLDGPAAAIRTARAVAERHGGRLLVLDPTLGLPAFSPAHGPGPLTRRVAAALDPDARLAPWRWER
jgi:glycolate oxidase FAD binding subunit